MEPFDKMREKLFTPDGRMKPPYSLIILGVALLSGVLLALHC